VYTLTLHKGIKFTDGTPLNAAAVKFNLDRYRQPASLRALELQYVKDITVTGKYSLKITLSTPFAPFLSILTDRSGMIVSPKAVQDEGETGFRNNPVCSGPYKYVDRVKADHIDLTANTHYWKKGLPKTKNLVFKIFTDANSALVNLQTGQLDFIGPPPTALSLLKGQKKYVVVNKPSISYFGIYLNVTAAPLTNRTLRQAIDAAVDRKGLAKVVYRNTVQPAWSPFGLGVIGHDKNDVAPKQNIAKAKQLVAKSGVSDPTFTLKIASGSTIAQQEAAFIQSNLKQAGITMNIQQEDFATLLSDGGKHNFQAMDLGWSGRPDPDQNIYDFFVTGSKNNYEAYSNPKVDSLLAKARKTLKAKKRKPLYDQVMGILHKDVPYVFTYHGNNVFAYSSKLTGFKYVPDGIIRAYTITKK
jgi:peptide/nickel transport system substrate-binding protein